MRSFNLSYARPGDLELLVLHRQSMWLDLHPEFAKLVQESTPMTRRWIRRQMSRGKLVGFIVRTSKGEAAGSGCIWIREEQPRPANPRSEVPYLMSMYTAKEFRRRGVAKLIVKAALRWCREHRYERVVLHASTQGRPLYEGLGFEPSSEMRLRL